MEVGQTWTYLCCRNQPRPIFRHPQAQLLGGISNTGSDNVVGSDDGGRALSYPGDPVCDFSARGGVVHSALPSQFVSIGNPYDSSTET